MVKAQTTAKMIRVLSMIESHWLGAQPANAGHLLFGELLYLIAVLDLINEDLGRLEAGDIMLIDHDGGVAGDIPGDLFLSFLVDEASESPDIDILAAGH